MVPTGTSWWRQRRVLPAAPSLGVCLVTAGVWEQSLRAGCVSLLQELTLRCGNRRVKGGVTGLGAVQSRPCPPGSARCCSWSHADTLGSCTHHRPAWGMGTDPLGWGPLTGLLGGTQAVPPGPTSHIHCTSLNLKAKLKLAFPSEQHLLFCHSPLWLTRSLLAAPGSCATKMNSDESQETQGGSRGLQRWGRDNLVTILPIRIVLLRGQRGVWHLWESRNELSSAQ